MYITLKMTKYALYFSLDTADACLQMRDVMWTQSNSNSRPSSLIQYYGCNTWAQPLGTVTVLYTIQYIGCSTQVLPLGTAVVLCIGHYIPTGVDVEHSGVSSVDRETFTGCTQGGHVTHTSHWCCGRGALMRSSHWPGTLWMSARRTDDGGTHEYLLLITTASH